MNQSSFRSMLCRIYRLGTFKFPSVRAALVEALHPSTSLRRTNFEHHLAESIIVVTGDILNGKLRRKYANDFKLKTTS